MRLQNYVHFQNGRQNTGEKTVMFWRLSVIASCYSHILLLILLNLLTIIV